MLDWLRRDFYVKGMSRTQFKLYTKSSRTPLKLEDQHHYAMACCDLSVCLCQCVFMNTSPVYLYYIYIYMCLCVCVCVCIYVIVYVYIYYCVCVCVCVCVHYGTGPGSSYLQPAQRAWFAVRAREFQKQLIGTQDTGNDMQRQ